MIVDSVAFVMAVGRRKTVDLSVSCILKKYD
mgnify:CR=1 FL=1